jgi:hypothetical protein
VSAALVSSSATRTEAMRTVFLPQQLPLHAEDGVDNLLLLASHGDEASGQFLGVCGGRVARWESRVLRRRQSGRDVSRRVEIRQVHVREGDSSGGQLACGFVSLGGSRRVCCGED